MAAESLELDLHVNPSYTAMSEEEQTVSPIWTPDSDTPLIPEERTSSEENIDSVAISQDTAYVNSDIHPTVRSPESTLNRNVPPSINISMIDSQDTGYVNSDIHPTTRSPQSTINRNGPHSIHGSTNSLNQTYTLNRQSYLTMANGSTHSLNSVGRDDLPNRPRNRLNVEQRSDFANSLYSNRLYYRGNVYEAITNAAPSVAQPDVPQRNWWLEKYDSDKEKTKQKLKIVLQVLFVISVILSLVALGLSLYVAIHQTQQFNTLDTSISDIQNDFAEFLPISGSVLQPECGRGFWQRVAYINMTDPNQQCPGGWRLYEQNGIRGCGRPFGSSTCESVHFPVSGSYDRVCGRARGYAYNSPDAFRREAAQPQGTPDDVYLDGLSITYTENPRRHIWSFAGTFYFNCPCDFNQTDTSLVAPPPPYVGDNYFCESSFYEFIPNTPSDRIYSENPLWDGQGCNTTISECCEGQVPPNWFRVNFGQLTTSDIEARLCGDQNTEDEDVVIELVEIYVQSTSRFFTES